MPLDFGQHSKGTKGDVWATHDVQMEILSRSMSREVDSSAFIRYIHSGLVIVEVVESKRITLRHNEARHTARALPSPISSDKRRINDPGLSRRTSHPFRCRGTDQWLKSR
jgi:hypothetical protein